MINVPKRVVIVEDNVPLSRAFESVLKASGNYLVTSCYDNCEEALHNLSSDLPDIIIMDIKLPGMNGVEGTKLIKKQRQQTLILVITVFEDSQMVFDALCAGASGYLTKNVSGEKLLNALEELIYGGAPMSMNIAKLVVQSFQKNISTILTDREVEVITLLSKGKSYKSIGDQLYISKNTIKFHIKNIYDKLEVNTKEDAIKEAEKQKII